MRSTALPALVLAATAGSLLTTTPAAAAPEDTVPPTVRIQVADPDRGIWYRASSVTLTYQVSDAGSGVNPFDAVVRLTGASSGEHDISGGSTPITVGAQGVTRLAHAVSDNAGNGRTSSTEVGLDNVPPLARVTGVTEGQRVLQGSSHPLTEACSDATSGLARCTIETGPTLITSTPGTRTVRISAEDEAGNTSVSEIGYTVVSPDTKPFTTVLPTVYPNGNGWYGAAVTLEARSSSPDGSAIDRIDWSVGNPGRTGTSNGDRTVLTVDADGSTDVLARGIDALGRVGGWATYTVRIDTSPPHTELTAGGPYQMGEQAEVPDDCFDDDSGIAGRSYGGDTVEDRIDTSTPGTKTVRLVCQNRAGGMSEATRTYEVHAPAVSLTGLPREVSSRTVLRPLVGLVGDDTEGATVRLLDGATVLGTYAPGARPSLRLAPGRHVLTAAHTNRHGVEVRSASAVVTSKSPTQAVASYRLVGRKVVARIKLAGLDARATGRVVLLDGSKRIGTGQANAKGVVTIRVRLAPGKHRLRAAYAGSSLTLPVTTKRQTVRVR